jgi:hypothetical protein
MSRSSWSFLCLEIRGVCGRKWLRGNEYAKKKRKSLIIKMLYCNDIDHHIIETGTCMINLLMSSCHYKRRFI